MAGPRRHARRTEQGPHSEGARRATADHLGFAYQTVRHHLEVLERNDVVTSVDEDYGSVYLPSDRARRHWDTVEQIIEQVDTS